MANNRFQIKRTYVTGRLPNTTDPSNSQYIAAGEFAMNMVDRQLYTSNGSTLITIGSTGTSLQLSDSIRIGDISTQLLTINSTSIFAGNTTVTTYVNTTSISVANSSSNISINPTTLFVGNDTANVSLSMAGGTTAIPIASANINSNAVVTIRTTVNHGITTLTQSKLLVSANNISLNNENYSAEYEQFGFDIRAVPTPNTISFVLPNDSFKSISPGNRTIKSIERFANGVVQVETKGYHYYSNGDLVYASGVGHVLADFYISGGSPVRVINPTTVTYTQNAYATVTRSLIGAEAFIYTPLLEANKDNVYFFGIQAADPIFNGFYPGDTITYVGLPQTISGDGFNNNAYSPSHFNGNHDIWNSGGVQINTPNTKTVLVKAGVMQNFEIGRYLFPVSSPYILSQGAIKISFEEVGKVNNNSQLCPVLQTSAIDGFIVSTVPTGISLKNGSKLVYVLDNIIFVGNTSIGNIVDSKGSRAFRPDIVTIESPTYNITPSKYYVSEGESIIFNITTTFFGSGTLYWTNIGTTIGADFDNGLNSGSINIENDAGSFTLTLANDLLLEGPQSIQIELRTGSTSGPVVATTFIISVNDTSFPPTYKITPNVTNLNEGQTITYQVETTGVASGTTLYWTNDGTGVTTTGADFTDNLNSGSFIINSGVGIITRTLKNDLLIDGVEYVKLRLRNGSTSGTIVAEAASVTVFDSSVPYYNVVASPSNLNVNEGGAVLFTVTAYGSALQGTTIYWSNEGTTTAADFNENINSGPLTIGAGNTASVALTLKNDLLLEGTETIVFQLRSGSVNGPPITAVSPYATTATVSINDTSVPTYSVAANITSINEGGSVLFTITTTGVANGATLYWTNEGSTTDEDFVDGQNAGSFTVNSSGIGYVALTLKNDLLIEGTETIRLRVRTGSISGDITSGLSPIVTVLDTSTPSTLFRVSSIVPSVSSVNEGQSITFTINFQTNTVPNGSYLYWYNSGTTSGKDFTDGLNSDMFIVNNNQATINRTLLSDNLSEGAETIVFEVHADSFSGPLLGSSTVTVNDSSLGTYSVSPVGDYFFNETTDSTIRFDITTTNVAAGTKLYWDIPYNPPYSTVTAADFTDNMVSGSLIISQLGTARVNLYLAADRLTEPREGIIFRLLNNPNDTTALAVSSQMIVDDTSTFVDYQFSDATYAKDLWGSGTLPTFTVAYNTTTPLGPYFYIIGPPNTTVNLILRSWTTSGEAATDPTYNKSGYRSTFTQSIQLNSSGQAYYNGYKNTYANRGIGPYYSEGLTTHISADLVSTDGKFKQKYPKSITFRGY